MLAMSNSVFAGYNEWRSSICVHGADGVIILQQWYEVAIANTLLHLFTQ